MMPLNLATPGEEQVIRRIGGNAEVKRHLEDLGFTAGGTVSLISVLNGSVIVKVRESRIAINEDLARRIMI